MADQQRWFKLWITAPADDDIQALPPEHRWAWAVLGCYTKAHGTRGRVTIQPSNAVLAAEMGIKQSALIDVISALPHVRVDGPNPANGSVTVTWENWLKYQEDATIAERVARLRSKKRRDEMRRDESIKTGTALSRAATALTSHADNGTDPARSLLEFLNKKTGRNYRPVASTLGLIRSRLRSGATPDQMRAVIAVKCREWRDGELAIYLRPSTLFRASNFESYLGQLPATAFTREDNTHA